MRRRFFLTSSSSQLVLQAGSAHPFDPRGISTEISAQQHGDEPSEHPETDRYAFFISLSVSCLVLCVEYVLICARYPIQILAPIWVTPSSREVTTASKLSGVLPALSPCEAATYARSFSPDDFDAILDRARRAGVGIQLLTGDCIPGSQEVLELATRHDGLYATVGCHPCRATEMDKYEGGIDAYVATLDRIIADNKARGKVLAVGECGLDYDRLFLASKEAQMR